MTTKISDIIIPEVFNPYFLNRTTEIAKFYMGGIVSNDASLDKLASSGGKILQMPFWNDLTGDDEILSDQSGLTPGAITAVKTKLFCTCAAVHGALTTWHKHWLLIVPIQWVQLLT